MSAGPLSEPYFKNTGWTREEFNEELYIRWYNKRKIDGNKFVRKT